MSTLTILLTFLLIIGIAIIYMQFKLSDEKCLPERVIYKYIPRTFKEEQQDPLNVEDMFKKVFDTQTDVLSR